MIALLPAAARRLGVRASAYVNRHVTSLSGRKFNGRHAFIERLNATPRGVIRTLDRVYGRPSINGERSYWEIPASEFLEKEHLSAAERDDEDDEDDEGGDD